MKATLCDRDKRPAREKPYTLTMTLTSPDGEKIVDIEGAELCDSCAEVIAGKVVSQIVLKETDPSIFKVFPFPTGKPTPRATAPAAAKPAEGKPGA